MFVYGKQSIPLTLVRNLVSDIPRDWFTPYNTSAEVIKVVIAGTPVEVLDTGGVSLSCDDNFARKS